MAAAERLLDVEKVEEATLPARLAVPRELCGAARGLWRMGCNDGRAGRQADDPWEGQCGATAERYSAAYADGYEAGRRVREERNCGCGTASPAGSE